MKDKPQKNFDNATVKRLFSYVTSGYKVKFIFVVITIIITCLVTVVLTLFLKVLVDQIIAPLVHMNVPDYSTLKKYLIIMSGVGLVGVIEQFIYARLMANIGHGVQKTIRDQMFSHMQTLPVSYFDTHPFGDTMSHYTNDVDTLRQMLTQSIPQVIANVTSILMALIAMIFTNYILTIILLVGVFGMMQIAKFIAINTGQYYAKQQESLGNINGYVEEMVNGQKVIKVFCHEEQTEKDFDKLNETLRKTSTKANTFSNVLMPLMMNMGNALYAVIGVVGGIMAINKTLGMTAGLVVAFLQLTKGFINPLSQMSQQFNSVVMALAGAKRIFAFIDQPSETDNGYVTLINAEIVDGKIIETDKNTGVWAWKHPHNDGTTTYTRLMGNVVFDDVDFSYDGKKLVLNDVSMHADSGEKLALVGATGAGKTTITNLINRFYDIADGKIRYDGININKIRKSDLRRSLGIVLQDTNLFTGTIADNIRYGKLDATMEEVKAAAKLAYADGFIERLPKGYETEISGNSESLSQGQRQLLSIARAAISDPPVMILDEATSSIDTHTEGMVQKGMDSLMKGRTVFVIAHRLSTVRNSQAILVMDHGRIIERGTHQQLIDEKGRYYQLYTGAFELE